MGKVLAALAFALALSLDGLGTGLSYGALGIKLPWYSTAIIGLSSTLGTFLVMTLGHRVAEALPGAWAERIGALVIIGIGITLILRGMRLQGAEAQKELLRLRLPAWGIVIQVLKEPARADLDSSGTITLMEALLLGVALALDSLGAGFGLALAGVERWLISFLVGAFLACALVAGARVGSRLQVARWGSWGSVLPGLLLVTLGVIRNF